MQTRWLVVSTSAIAFALVGAAGNAFATTSVCDGLTDCVVAPATPVVVAVTSSPTTYEVACPAGLTPVRHAVSTQPGVVAVSVPNSQGEDGMWSYTPGVAATVPASPTVAATTTVADTIVAGTSAANPSFWGGSLFGIYGGIQQVEDLTAQGDTATSGEQGSVTVPRATGSLFTAVIPPSVPSSASGVVPWETIPNGGEPWSVSLSGWNWMTAGTMTPSIGCTPVPTPRKRVTHRRVSIDRSVRVGHRSHWLRCPRGTTRYGGLQHAVYVPGRSRLTLAQRRAIDSRLVTSSGGGQHVRTRLGAAAPDGVRVQLHAICRG